MSEIATPSQLRQSFLRWAAVTVPLILLLGTAMGVLSGASASNPWYVTLIKPHFTPRGTTFELVWTILYILMGFALAMILHARRARGRTVAIAFFVIQLLVNLTWIPIFFHFHNIQLAMGWLLLLLFALLATILAFRRIRPLAGWLLAPYLLWLCFAGLLNYKIGQLNPNGGQAAQSNEVAF